MEAPAGYEYESFRGLTASEDHFLVSAVSEIFSSSFGNNPKTGKPYRLGPKTTRERLKSTDYLFLAKNSKAKHVGYLYGREIGYLENSVGWIDSVAVLPDFRRKGIATQLVGNLVKLFSNARWVGCATPNPVAALVVTKVVKGKVYVGDCNTPQEIIIMLNSIRAHCPDLRGAEFNSKSLLIRTNFSPTHSGDSREWSPPEPTEPPPWWSTLEKLPSQYEALLVAEIYGFPFSNPI